MLRHCPEVHLSKRGVNIMFGLIEMVHRDKYTAVIKCFIGNEILEMPTEISKLYSYV